MKRIIKQRDKDREEKLPKAPKTNTANNTPYISGPGILTLTLAPILAWATHRVSNLILVLTVFPRTLEKGSLQSSRFCVSKMRLDIFGPLSVSF